LPANAPAALDVACVVVTHNGRRWIGDCLHSLRTSARPAELLVVDNGSTDETLSAAREAAPDARIVALGENLGYGAAGNAGAALSSAEYVAIVNQDVVARSGWLDSLIAALEASPSSGLATPKILLADHPTRLNAAGNLPHVTGLTICRGYNRSAADFRRTEVVPAVSGAAFAIRRSLLRQLGGFDALFFLYLEDTDLSLRAALAGYRCLFVPEATVLHAFEPRFDPRKLHHLERNRQVMLLRLYRWRTLALLLPALLLTELLVLGYATLRGPACLRAKLDAYVWVAARLPAILRSRQQVQRTRTEPDRALLALCVADLDLDELDQPLARLATSLANPFYRLWLGLARRLVRW
jgi:GT2 family glycosyltransferase